jgi:hypothetical protein
MNKKIILTDCDGVILDWEYAFDVWMTQHGFKSLHNMDYSIGTRYDISPEQGKKLIKIFNESAAIGFLPALRDSMFYVKRLHEELGYVFHAITSLSLDKNAQELRIQNLRKLFGKTAFEKFIILDTGADKDEALLEYKDSGLYWVEDKPENANCGADLGLHTFLMEHGHNMNHDSSKYTVVKNWKEIYDTITKNN